MHKLLFYHVLYMFIICNSWDSKKLQRNYCSIFQVDECSVNGDSGAEEDEDEELSQGSGTESSSNSSGSSTTTDSGEESADDQATSSSESHTSVDEEEEENETVEHPEEVTLIYTCRII